MVIRQNSVVWLPHLLSTGVQCLLTGRIQSFLLSDAGYGHCNFHCYLLSILLIHNSSTGFRDGSGWQNTANSDHDFSGCTFGLRTCFGAFPNPTTELGVAGILYNPLQSHIKIQLTNGSLLLYRTVEKDSE